jgi:hypothetical protein
MIKDALDNEIELLRERRQTLRAQLEQAEIELKALEKAAELRPIAVQTAARSAPSLPEAVNGASRSRRGGRQPGSIGEPWRGILRRVAEHYPNGAASADFASFGPALGLHNLRPTDARQQVEKYIEHGFIERIAEDRYKVTSRAIERFGALERGPIPELPGGDQL